MKNGQFRGSRFHFFLRRCRTGTVYTMQFIKTPVKGMRDCLPSDMKLRQKVISMIRETYAKYGFSEIETPAMEHIENLTSKQGGENEKLIFKILKRGEELNSALAYDGELCDSGLRYDLTVPLARYYANNIDSLPAPFKALQIGCVWRADKPQKGRFRQFTQCDIDILGENTMMAEIELISATADMLTRIFGLIGIRNFTVHVSDRRILRAMAAYAGFAEESFNDVFIILDKFDKIGLDGIRKELTEKGYAPEAIEKYTEIFSRACDGQSCSEFCSFLKDGWLEADCAEGLDTILTCVRAMAADGVKIVFDPTLVRGMSYYTGTIFECSIDGYSFSIAGGGRYDKMIGRFSGMDVSACGFSIGFERIITILTDHIDEIRFDDTEKYAFLIEKGVSTEKTVEIFRKAAVLRAAGSIVTVQTRRKNAKAQKDKLAAEGYTNITDVYK